MNRLYCKRMYNKSLILQEITAELGGGVKHSSKIWTDDSDEILTQKVFIKNSSE